MKLNNKITDYRIDKSIEELKNLLTEVINTNEKLFAALDDIHNIIDDQSNIYDPNCDDIEIIKIMLKKTLKFR